MKNIEEKFGLNTEEMGKILGGLTDAMDSQNALASRCTTCMLFCVVCAVCTGCVKSSAIFFEDQKEKATEW